MKIENLYRKIEISAELVSIGILAQILFSAFTKDQKEWFRHRDHYECQFPVKNTDESYTPCGSNKNLQVHHISPQRWSGVELGWSEDQIDSKDNGITLCERHHQGVIHNDMLIAQLAYKKDPQSFQKAFEARDRKVKEHKPYWNTAYNVLFMRILVARNLIEQMPFPKKRQKKERKELATV